MSYTQKLLLSELGGMPLRQNELAWMQDGLYSALLGLLSGFATHFKISGCTVTIPSTADTTAGYIVINGEILKVDAHSIAVVGGQTLYWTVEETYDGSLDPTDFADSSTPNIHAIRRGKLAYSASPPSGQDEASIQTLTQVLTTALDAGFITPAELTSALSSYVTSSSLTSTLASYATTAAVTAAISAALASYYTSTQVENYVRDNTILNTGSITNNRKSLILEIGEWDMDADSTKNIAHGLGANWAYVLQIEAFIMNDNGAAISPLTNTFGTTVGGHITINSSIIGLQRLASGFYDNTSYNATIASPESLISGNRGYVHILYFEP